MSLLSLPPEILVQVLQQLSVTSFLQCHAVCRGLKAVIDANEDHIFHFLIGFVSSSSPQQSLREYTLANPHLSLDDVENWKALCEPFAESEQRAASILIQLGFNTCA